MVLKKPFEPSRAPTESAAILISYFFLMALKGNSMRGLHTGLVRGEGKGVVKGTVTTMVSTMFSTMVTTMATTMVTLASTSGYAETELTHVLSLAYQNKELSFDQRYSGPTIVDNEAKFSTYLPMLNVGFTLAYGRFFGAFKYEQNLSDASTLTRETDRSTELEANLLTLPGGTIDVERQDISLTVGMNVWRSLSIFTGILSGKTELTPDPFCGDFIIVFDPDDLVVDPDSGLAQVNCTRTNRAGIQYFLEDQNFYENLPRYRQKYTEFGAFAGASYALNIADLGSLTLSLAYADMDGEYEDNATDPENYFQNFVAFGYKGKTTGTSLAVTWTSSLGDNSTYFVDLRDQSYSMRGFDTTGRLTDVTLQTDERMIGVSAGIQFYF